MPGIPLELVNPPGPRPLKPSSLGLSKIEYGLVRTEYQLELHWWDRVDTAYAAYSKSCNMQRSRLALGAAGYRIALQ